MSLTLLLRGVDHLNSYHHYAIESQSIHHPLPLVDQSLILTSHQCREHPLASWALIHPCHYLDGCIKPQQWISLYSLLASSKRVARSRLCLQQEDG